jgi:hypothetical protein
MSTVVYPQTFNAGVPPCTNWSLQIERNLVGSREFAVVSKMNEVEIVPLLPKDAAWFDKLIHFIKPTLSINEGPLTKQTAFNAFLNKKENDLSTMSPESCFLVCRVELTEKANDLMGAMNYLVLFTVILAAGVGSIVGNMNPAMASYSGPLISLTMFVVLGLMLYWGYAFALQHTYIERYRELLRTMMPAEVGSFVWTEDSLRSKHSL